MPVAGDTFGKLTVLRREAARGKYKLLRCRCACGGEIVVRERHLSDGAVTSCGCHNKRQRNLAGFKVGELRILGPCDPVDNVEAVMCECDCGRRLRVKRGELLLGAGELCGCVNGRDPQPHREERSVWSAMLARCGVRGDSAQERYAGRGIMVCERWRTSFDAFIADVGPRPKVDLQLDRVDNDAHYSCGKCRECLEKGWKANCRWATRKEQAANRRRPQRRRPQNKN